MKKDELEILKAIINQKLTDIKVLFPYDVKLTILIRTDYMQGGVILVTPCPQHVPDSADKRGTTS